jgi:hypothetical protein
MINNFTKECLFEFTVMNLDTIVKQADDKSNDDLEVPVVPIIDAYIMLTVKKEEQSKVKTHFYYQMLPNLPPYGANKK